MAEATRIRGLFEASRLSQSVPFCIITRFAHTVHFGISLHHVSEMFNRHAPDGQALLKAGTVHLAQCVLCILFSSICSSYECCRYQHADPYHSSFLPSVLVILRILMLFAVPYVEGSSKWQRNIPPPASVRPLVLRTQFFYSAPSYLSFSDLR